MLLSKAVICKKRCHCKWRLANKRCTKKLKNCHIHDCIALISNVHKKIVGQKPHSSVIRSFPYSSVLMSYSVRRRIRGNVWRSGYHCLLHSAHFLLYLPSFLSVEHWYWFSIGLWYTNNQHHPYTTVLSDKTANMPLSVTPRSVPTMPM